MKDWKRIWPIGLLLLAEAAVGVLLFLKPEEFTRGLLIALGCVLALIGAWSLLRFFTEHRDIGLWNWATLTAAVLFLAAGGVLALWPQLVLGLFSAAAVVYGVFLILAGLYKGKTYLELRRMGFAAPAFLLIGAILSLGLGVLVVLHPFDSMLVLWRFTGVSLLIEAVCDGAALLARPY